VANVNTVMNFRGDIKGGNFGRGGIAERVLSSQGDFAS
jgi:hypothetical protein